MQIIGHRGAKLEWPENTLLGMKKALEAGCAGLEIDVHKTSDGKLVVIHDPTVDRTSNGSGKVKDMTYEELLQLDFGQGEKIPLLEDVLNFCQLNNLLLFIESKVADIAKELVEAIQKFNFIDKSWIICFYHPLLLEVKTIEPSIKVGSLCECNPVNPVSLLEETQSDVLAISMKTIDKSVVDKCHKAEKKIALWNANNREELEIVMSYGVDYIMTDYPSIINPLFKAKK